MVPKPPMNVRESQHRPLCSLKSGEGGLHSCTQLTFRAPTMCSRVSAVWKSCLYLYRSITAQVKSQSLKGWDLYALYTGWYAWVSCSPTPEGLNFASLRLPHHFHQWVIPLSRYPFCIEGFDVWFDTIHWFINVHFLKSLSSQMSNLQDSIHITSPPPPPLPLGKDLSCSGDSLHSCWLSSTPDILSSHLPPFI